MNYTSPINLTAVSRRTIDGNIVPALSENEKRYHIYTPPALIFIMFRKAEELRVLLKQSEIDFRKENREIDSAFRDFTARWHNKMRSELKEHFSKVVDEIDHLIGRDLAILLYCIDNELMYFEPDNENHLITSYAEVVKFLCSIIAERDKRAFEYLNVDMGLPRATWFIDDSVLRIARACDQIANRSVTGADVTDKIKDNTLQQVKTAIRIINKKLDAYKITF